MFITYKTFQVFLYTIFFIILKSTAQNITFLSLIYYYNTPNYIRLSDYLNKTT